MFVSKDTEPGRVKDPDKRYETVAPGSTYTKEIAPVKLIAYAPLKYSMNASRDNATFSAGPIPPDGAASASGSLKGKGICWRS